MLSSSAHHHITGLESSAATKLPERTVSGTSLSEAATLCIAREGRVHRSRRLHKPLEAPGKLPSGARAVSDESKAPRIRPKSGPPGLKCLRGNSGPRPIKPVSKNPWLKPRRCFALIQQPEGCCSLQFGHRRFAQVRSHADTKALILFAARLKPPQQAKPPCRGPRQATPTSKIALSGTPASHPNKQNRLVGDPGKSCPVAKPFLQQAVG